MPSTEKIYSAKDFSTPQAAPPDLALAPRYRTRKGATYISIRWPCYKLSPGTSREVGLPLVRRLAPLRRRLRQLLIDSRPDVAVMANPLAEVELLTRQGVPIRWAYFGLKQGVMFSFPGATFDDRYDPRQRPWYRRGQSVTGASWGSPRLDASGQGLVLTCVCPMINDRREFLGVAALDVTFDYLIETLLKIPELSGVREVYLLDREGRVVVRSRDLGRRGTSAQESGLNLVKLASESVLRELRGHPSSGIVETDDGEVYGYCRLDSLGWFFMVKASSQIVLGG